MHTDTPLTPWTRDELTAHAYVTAQQMRTPSTWDDEPWDEYDAMLATLALLRPFMHDEVSA